MTDEAVEHHPDFRRGHWMLNKQVDTAGDLMKFWMLFGPSPWLYPSPEKSPPWWRGFEDNIYP